MAEYNRVQDTAYLNTLNRHYDFALHRPCCPHRMLTGLTEPSHCGTECKIHNLGQTTRGRQADRFYHCLLLSVAVKSDCWTLLRYFFRTGGQAGQAMVQGWHCQHASLHGWTLETLV